MISRIFFVALALLLTLQYLEATAITNQKKPTHKQQSLTLVSNYTDFRLRENDISNDDLARILGWEKTSNDVNVCGGYYKHPDFLFEPKILPNIKTALTTITAKQRALLSEYGTSILKGDVMISQPGRMIVSDKIIIFRDKETSKITNIELSGGVKLYESGKLIIAKNGNFDFKNKSITLNDSAYKITTEEKNGAINAWGKANKISKDALNVLTLSKASYSTCPPYKPTWKITSNQIILDKNKGRGVAKNTTIYVKDIPVAYLPYFNFPLDERRKTGFLYPVMTNSNESGFSLLWPYYFNLAPNYDLTLSPQIIEKRGVFTSGLFRYLAKKDSGYMQIGYIPNDSLFEEFKKNAITEYPKGGHSLSRLLNASTSRGFFTFSDDATLNEKVDYNIKLNYVSDDYFQRDFYNIQKSSSQDQLLNQAIFKFNDEHISFLGRIQAFQTLHPLTYPGSVDQYVRLPQLILNTNYPDLLNGVDFNLNSQLTRFEHRKNFDTGKPVLEGDRLSLIPSISIPINTSYAYILPKLDLVATQYSLRNTPINWDGSLNQTLPIFSLDSGMLFQRDATVFNKHYNQTLEPKLYYLFVPYQNQDKFPNFDTNLPIFNLETSLRNNRFSGVDRVGDANQVTLAFATKFIDNYSGEEKIRAGIGQVYLFRKHDVCLDKKSCSLDPLTQNKFSPLIGSLQYAISNNWFAGTNIAWDPSHRVLNNSSINVNYKDDANRALQVGYNFIKNGDNFQNTTNDLNRVNVAFSLPLKKRWKIVSEFDYNISYIHTQNFSYGLEYENCCFALRLGQNRSFIGIASNNALQFETQIYLNFSLKGLSNTTDSRIGGNDNEIQ